ncbi:MAG: hypothetical protein Q4C50_12365 [Eubacteriales bacterium]|nr:hypothetical protein [Eubacteriales bacterium]
MTKYLYRMFRKRFGAAASGRLTALMGMAAGCILGAAAGWLLFLPGFMLSAAAGGALAGFGLTAYGMLQKDF